MLLLRTLVFCLVSIPLLAVAKDLQGSQDDNLIQRPAGSWIVQYQAPELKGYTLALGSIEKVNGVERLEKELRLKGKLTRISYRIPEGSRVRDYIDFFNTQINSHGAEELFSCKGRECGSSNFWANQVFDYSKLYGVDRNQYYVAAKLPGVYLAVYVIERGNRRQYAHIDLIETDSVARKLSEYEQLGYVELSVDALPDKQFLIDVLEGLNQKSGAAIVVHHAGEDLESAFSDAEIQAAQLRILLNQLSASTPLSVHSVGSWVPSVLAEHKMVLQLVSGGN